jgi:hypothetical protein
MKISTLTPAKVRGEGQLGFRHLDGHREQRNIDYTLLKGRHYLARAGNFLSLRGDRQPVNLLQQLVRTLTPFLAINAPLADVTPLRADLEFESQVRKQIFDTDAQKMKLHEVYQDAVNEAILSGVAFTLNGLKSGGDVYTAGNRRLSMGQEFCRVLDMDDIALDPNAKTLDGLRFFMHRYPISREDALDGVSDGCFGAIPGDYQDGVLPNPNIATPEEAAQIINACTAVENLGRRGDRVDQNDGEWATYGDRLDETILLWDCIFYMHGEVWVVTLPAEPGQQQVFGMPGGVDKFLACYKWRGPESGPVNRLTFLRVPFNKIPLALAQMQRDLAEVADLLANKTFRQLIQTRNMVVYEGSAENMAMAMKNGAQGSYIRGNPNSVKNIQTGGMIPDMMPGTQYFMDQWQQCTGNLAMAAGTGDTGKTATAFEGMMSRIQSFLDFLRSRVEQLATDDLNVRSWYLTNNPAFQRIYNQTIGQAPAAMTMAVQVANPGAPAAQQQMQQQAQQAPGQPQPGVPMGQPPQPPQQGQPGVYVMQGDHDDFNHKVRAFSMQYQNPTISAQQYQQAITNVVPAIMQMMQGGFNGQAAMAILARKLNEPELENLLPDQMTQMLQQQASQAEQQIAQDPAGQGDIGGYSDPGSAGPAGRRIPGQVRMSNRAMRPGPGQGSPRPMMGAQQPTQTAGVGV